MNLRLVEDGRFVGDLVDGNVGVVDVVLVYISLDDGLNDVVDLQRNESVTAAETKGAISEHGGGHSR